jgi:hypothetical protein
LTVPDGLPDGTAIAHAVERLRDLVRRSLLARICLAANDTLLWSLDADTGVDMAVIDDLRRKAWQETMTGIDAIVSADPRLA